MQLIKLWSVQKEGGGEREDVKSTLDSSKESYKDNTGWFSCCVYDSGELLIPFKSEYA